jgi:hypothetical protein
VLPRERRKGQSFRLAYTKGLVTKQKWNDGHKAVNKTRQHVKETRVTLEEKGE